MNAEHISDALNLLDDDLLDEANALRGGRKRPRWPKRLAAAACLVLAVCVGAGLRMGRTQNAPPPDIGLPLLPPGGESLSAGGMGFEGYMAFDCDELVNANPWTERMKLSTLPVFRNLNPLDSAGAPITAPDPERLRELLLETAALLGLSPDDVEISEEPYLRAVSQTDGVQIHNWTDRDIAIWFDPYISLPVEYQFDGCAAYGDLSALAEYFKTTYRDLLAMDNPQVNISGGDYFFNAEQSFNLSFFDAGDSELDTLLNYNFRQADFYVFDNGLSGIRLHYSDLSEKVGDYPIITPSEAQRLLLEGHYITNTPYELPGKRYVKKVELLYLTSGQEEYFMPYYRFLAELPEAGMENGLNCYGAYYVPAVDAAYLTNLPVWDGSFN